MRVLFQPDEAISEGILDDVSLRLVVTGQSCAGNDFPVFSKVLRHAALVVLLFELRSDRRQIAIARVFAAHDVVDEPLAPTFFFNRLEAWKGWGLSRRLCGALRGWRAVAEYQIFELGILERAHSWLLCRRGRLRLLIDHAAELWRGFWLELEARRGRRPTARTFDGGRARDRIRPLDRRLRLDQIRVFVAKNQRFQVHQMSIPYLDRMCARTAPLI